MTIKDQDEGYNLIWVVGLNPLMISNPKNLIDMSKEKAEGSIKWTKRILGKRYPAFIYDPSQESIFLKNGSLNKEKILKKVYLFGGVL